MTSGKRFGSTEQQDFNEAYRNRPVLNALVLALWLTVIGCVLFAGWLLLAGAFLKSVGALLLAATAFAIWAVLHNWALTHPK